MRENKDLLSFLIPENLFKTEIPVSIVKCYKLFVPRMIYSSKFRLSLCFFCDPSFSTNYLIF